MEDQRCTVRWLSEVEGNGRGREELVQADVTPSPPTPHIPGDLPECPSRPIFPIATCILFGSPRDYEPPGKYLALLRVPKRKGLF